MWHNEGMGKLAVLGFIEEKRARGMSDKEILYALLRAGWPTDIVMRALDYKPLEKASQLVRPVVPRSRIYRFAGGFKSLL